MEATNPKKRKPPAKPKKTPSKPSKAMNMWFDIPKDGVLLPSIEKHLLLKQARSDRRLDCIHPSSMAHHDWCPRMEYFKLMGAKPPIETHRFQMSNVFEEGHLIHRKWQQWLQEMGNLRGIYQCNWCQQRRWYDNPPQGVECPGCQWKDYTYREVPLYDEERMIAGHADGLTDQGLIEIKSIGMGTVRMEEPGLFVQFKDADELWKNLKRPMASHLRQANLYLALLPAKARTDTAIFLYEFKATQAVKEFVITYSPDIADPLLDKAEEIAHCVRTQDHIPVCYTGKSCRKCEAYETAYRRTS